ncbi:hypothetical protein [Brevibacillus parabrevis]|uniref:hypothetical protein n=1 Tax=Brevibacillus parabrevis TaxID=54914 RepID=UPI000AE6144C|nr:hypothetical protein [Brevibacillus parabrevis]
MAVVPGRVCGAGGEGFIRCSYASSHDDLQRALERMGKFMQAAAWQPQQSLETVGAL